MPAGTDEMRGGRQAALFFVRGQYMTFSTTRNDGGIPVNPGGAARYWKD